MFRAIAVVVVLCGVLPGFWLTVSAAWNGVNPLPAMLLLGMAVLACGLLSRGARGDWRPRGDRSPARDGIPPVPPESS